MSTTGRFLVSAQAASWSCRGGRLALDGPDLVVSSVSDGWVAPHERGLVAVAFGRVPLADVAEASVGELVRSLALIAAAINDRPPMVCRFCRQAFTSSQYVDSLGACHDCAQRNLGVAF